MRFKTAMLPLVTIAMLAAVTPAIASNVAVLNIDCDAGDDLRQALDEVFYPTAPPACPDDECADVPVPQPADEVYVNFSGTCYGPIEVPRRVYLKITGTDPAESILSGGDSGTVHDLLYVGRDSEVRLRDLTLQNAILGIRATNAWVGLNGCVLRGFQWIAIDVLESNVGISNSRIETNFATGVIATGGRLSVYNTAILDLAEPPYGGAAGVLGQLSAHVDVKESQVVGFSTGVSASYGSAVRVQNTVLESVIWEAAATFDGSVMLTGVDATRNCFAAVNSFLLIGSTTLGGDLFLTEFSKASILMGTVSGRIRCESAADASCQYSLIHESIGCDHCTATGSTESGDSENPSLPPESWLPEVVIDFWWLDEDADAQGAVDLPERDVQGGTLQPGPRRIGRVDLGG